MCHAAVKSKQIPLYRFPRLYLNLCHWFLCAAVGAVEVAGVVAVAGWHDVAST